MWHPIAFVAESRQVNVVALTEFAIANQDKYGIVVENFGPEVNTWYADKFVSDFKALQHAPEQAELSCPVQRQ